MDANKTNGIRISRRTVLARGAVAVGAAATLGLLTREAEAQAKVTQEVAGYQATPKDAQQCANCLHWKGGACALVEGSVAATGWCRLYSKKP